MATALPMTNKLTLALLIVVLPAAPVARAATLCADAEQAIFSCGLKGSPKTVSLCGSRGLTAKNGYLQYRFGRTGQIELEFPRERAASQQAFAYAHYFRAQVDRTEVSFENGGHRYAVFHSYEGEEKPAKRYAGVAITSPGSKTERILSCSGPVVNKLYALEDIVPCDEDNALNLGSCK